jgi:hypothetical protein
VQPRAGKSPIAFHSPKRDALSGGVQGIDGFFRRKASEETKFNYGCLPRMFLGQAAQSRIHLEHIRSRNGKRLLLQAQYIAAATLIGDARACMVQQDTAHQLRGNGKKLTPASPVNIPGRREPKVELVNQSRRLQSMPRAFLIEKGGGQMAQLVVHKKRQPVERVLIAIPPADQPVRDIRGGAMLDVHHTT